MKNPKKTAVSLGDIARAAGVSRVAVCYALRNAPGVSAATRKRILAISRRLGYAPDARVAAWMASVRDAKKKDFLPLAWLNTTPDTRSWREPKYLSPFWEGANERAAHLGYRIEEFWIHEPGMTLPRIAGMLFQRGIEGVIVTYPAARIRLDWKRFAGVAVGGALLAPRVHRVLADHHHNLGLALKILKRNGYRRIGVCIEQAADRYSAHTLREAAHYFHAGTAKAHQVPPLFYVHRGDADWPAAKRHIVDWLSAHRPEVVVTLSNRLPECVRAAGFRVPEDVGVVHLATDDDVADWAGVCSNRRLVGATAVELTVSMLRNRQLGVPVSAHDTMIRGAWHPGRTLLLPKPP